MLFRSARDLAGHRDSSGAVRPYYRRLNLGCGLEIDLYSVGGRDQEHDQQHHYAAHVLSSYAAWSLHVSAQLA